MKKKSSIIIVLLIVMAGLAVASLMPLKSNIKTIACEKPESQIGTCARLVHKQSVLGLGGKYQVELTPTNSENFEGANRKMMVELSKECGDGYTSGHWNEEGLTIQASSGATCSVQRSTIGQW